MNEKVLQLDFYENCMKTYNQHIDHTIKYGDGLKEIIYRDLFGRLMPDFCFVDYYNSYIKSSSSSLNLEFLPLHIVSVFQLKRKLKDTNVGQLLHYLRIVLDYSLESRLFILGAITDFRNIQFSKVSRSNDGDHIKYEASIKPLADEMNMNIYYII